MPELLREPAQTYQLNVLASALGRFAAQDLNPLSIHQASQMVELTIDRVQQDKAPIAPHTNPILLEEAAKFDVRLLGQLSHGPAKELLPPTVFRSTEAILQKHYVECKQRVVKGATPERLVNPSDIADAYGLPDLWDEDKNIMHNEASIWSEFVAHPPIPLDLQQNVSKHETRELVELMWRHIIKLETKPDVNIYLADNTENYHVYWAPLADTLDYVTPRSYDRAIQLSFDLPHNATHLAHLSLLDPSDGIFRYDDSMAQRSYFEAATVFSEYCTIFEARDNEDFVNEMHDILQPTGLTSKELRDWIIRDRGYEFKLRAARYAADVFMMEGRSFDDTTHEVSEIMQIPLVDAEKEAKKYLPWTGLGAVYSFGYRKLINMKVDSVSEVIADANGEPITSWSQRIAN